MYFFFKNIKKEKLIFIFDKKVQKQNSKIKYFNYFFDKQNFYKKYLINKLFYKNKFKFFNTFTDFFFFFTTNNKVILNKLSKSHYCSNIIIFSENNMSFSNFFFNMPIVYNLNFSINFMFYFLKFYF